MKNEMKNDEAVSPVIATILMVAITVVLAGVLYVWANELASNQTDAGTLNSYKAEDHPTDTTDGTDDNLMRLSFTTGPDDLLWDKLIITLFDEEDGQTYECSPGGWGCSVSEETADSVFGGSEIISIVENGVDICGASGNGGAEGNSCELKVIMTYDGYLVAGTSAVQSII